MARFSGVMVVAVAVGLGGSASRALAQPSSAQAETLFRQGRELLAAGKLEEACGAFESSQKLASAPTTQLNLADCREKRGQLATAWGIFVDVGRELRGATDASSKQLAKVAGGHAAKLEPRLSKLTITVAQANQVAGLEIRRGTDLVDSGAWNLTLPIDGGTYTISAHAPGHADWSASVTVKTEGDKQTIEVPALPVAKAVPVATTTTSGKPTSSTTAEAMPPQPPSTHRSHTPAFALGGAAIVLAGGALVFDLWGNSTYNDSKVEPDLTKQTSEWHSANDKRYVAEGLGVAAVGCAGVAIWMYLRSGNSESSTEVARGNDVHVLPMIAGDAAGFVLSGQY